MVKAGQVWSGVFVALDATGALATPSVGPAGVLYVDGTANGAAVTISGANPYKWTVTLPALTAGQCVSMYITATIATIATASVVAEDVADTVALSDVATAVADVPTVTEFNARTLVAADYTVVSDLGTVQTGDTYAVVTNATYGLDKLARTGADSDTLETLSDQLDAVDASAIATAVWAVASGSGAEDSYGNILDDLTEEASGVYAFTAAALAAAPGGGGTLYSYSNTVDDGSGNLLDGVFIQLATDSAFVNVVTTTHTNALGAFTVRSDTSGTHYLRLQLAGYEFADQTVTLA